MSWDSLLPFLNKYTLSILVAVVFYALNMYELLGESSIPQMDPLLASMVGLLCFGMAFAIEWALRRQGFLLSTKTIPDVSSSATPDVLKAAFSGSSGLMGSSAAPAPILSATSW